MKAQDSVLIRTIATPAFWGWLILASLPPQLISWTFGWDIVDPAYLALMLLWWPVDTLGRLGALRILLENSRPQDLRRPWRALPSALAAEVLLSLRLGVVALAGLIPGLFLFSLVDVRPLAHRFAVAAVCLLGLIPALLYALRRLLAPVWLLKQPLTGAEALDASRGQLRGYLLSFLVLALPWILAGWTLDLAGFALEEQVNWILAPLSLGLALVPLAKFTEPKAL